MPVRSTTIVPLVAPSAAAASNGPPGSNGVPLNIPNVPQVQDFWCWAACTLMVLRHKGAASADGVCDIVNMAFKLTKCCDRGKTFDCNRALPLPGAVPPNGGPAPIPLNVDLVGVYKQHGIEPTVVRNSISFVELQNELRARQPVEICLETTGGGGHVVLAIGWHQEDGASQFIRVNDPQLTKNGGTADGFVLFTEYATGNLHGNWIATLTGLN